MHTETREGVTHKWLSCSDTAKLVREVLKKQFPGTKFSVRSKTYAGGGQGQTGLIVDTSFEQPPASEAYLQLVDYVDGEKAPGARMGRRVGYLTLDRSDGGVPKVRLRDPRRRGGSQYSPIFERHIGPGASEPLELRCANGRYAQVAAFFASGAAARVGSACRSCGSADTIDSAGRCDACGALQ